MDPHSKFSQFNHRVTKAGPQSRNIEPIPPPPLPKDSFKMPSRKQSISTKAVIRRPLATNSRVKQDEIFKRDMYLSFVTNALQQKTNGLSDSFDELVGQFSRFPLKPNSNNTQLSQADTAQIRLWIVALSHVVSRLERTHASLVHAIVNMPWTILDNATVKSYTIFIGMLLSAKPEYLSFVLAMIAQGFTYQSGLQALDTSLPESSRTPVTRRLIYDRLHDLLRHILSLIPTLPSSLQISLIMHFPHKRQNQVAQATYIRNLLRVSSYCTELADKILATIIDRAIQIDVEIQIELEELEEDGSVEDHDIFELDPFDVVLGQEGDPLSDDEDSDENDGDNFSDLSSDFGDMDGNGVNVEVPTNIKHIQDMVNKLDAILTLLFEHFQRTSEAVAASNSSRPLLPLELPPLPPLSSSTPSLLNPHTTSFGPSSTPLTPTLPSPQSQQTSSAPVQHTEQYVRLQFQALLSIFDRIILRTFKSRYTQFLIFWYTSLDPQFADIFQGMLVDRALLGGGAEPHHYGGSTTAEDGDKSATMNAYIATPELTRAAAASYIGSFVSRATFVDREGARRVVGVLCEFLNAHLESVEEALRAGWAATSAVGGDGTSFLTTATQRQHTVFYAVTQAVFLIFCFRWRDLVDEEDMGDDDEQLRLYLDSNGMVTGRTKKPISNDKSKWMPELGILKRVVVSVLNPLKVCSSNVVMQFARVAHATDFIYCYTILETNKRAEHVSTITSPSPPSLYHRQSSSDVPTMMNTRFKNPMTKINLPVNPELNAFFPFDPYRLPKSSAFIQGVYREWSSVAIEDEDEEEDEEEEEKEKEEEEEEEFGRDEDGTTTSSRYLSIRRDKENDGGLGESLGAMSISPR